MIVTHRRFRPCMLYMLGLFVMRCRMIVVWRWLKIAVLPPAVVAVGVVTSLDSPFSSPFSPFSSLFISINDHNGENGDENGESDHMTWGLLNPTSWAPWPHVPHPSGTFCCSPNPQENKGAKWHVGFW